MGKPTIILIGGPTASGKSALATALARQSPCTIINADAMQVYAGLPILTAQPDDKTAAPHELYEILDPSEKSSVGKWVTLAEEAINRSVDAGRLPILVGGTGLYFKALVEGLATIPPIPDDVRNNVQALYDTVGSDAFRQNLAKKDPASASRIKPNDKQRLIRAYEVVAHTGKTLEEWQRNTQNNGVGDKFNVKQQLILPPRETLYAACDARFEQMLERGAREEVRALLARNLDPELPAMKILGVRELGGYLRGEITLNEAKIKAQQVTRHYAKRQVTWFRNRNCSTPPLT